MLQTHAKQAEERKKEKNNKRFLVHAKISNKATNIVRRSNREEACVFATASDRHIQLTHIIRT